MKTGKPAESVLKRSILKQVHHAGNRNSAAVGADCAFFAAPEGQILAWRVQEAAVAGQADMDDAAYVIQKCANNLAAAGAAPISALIGLMLPENYGEDSLKELMKRMASSCENAGIEIAGGDTNISAAVTMPVLTVTMLGTVRPEEKREPAIAKAGQELVLSKWIGLEGTAVLARTRRTELLARYPAYLVDTAAGFDEYLSVQKEAGIALKNGAAAMHDLSQGGVFGALWELAEGSGLGLKADLKKIPIRQETVEVCEVCGVNPYEMRSAGSLLMTAEDGESLAEALRQAGIPAAVIGKLTENRDRIIVNGEETRFLDRPKGADVIAEAMQHFE